MDFLVDYKFFLEGYRFEKNMKRIVLIIAYFLNFELFFLTILFEVFV